MNVLTATVAARVSRKAAALPRFVVVPAAAIASWRLTRTTVIDLRINDLPVSRRTLKPWTSDVWFLTITQADCDALGIDSGSHIDCPTKIAYVLSNACPDVTMRRLAYMQAQRYWVERVFEDAKTEAGLGDYQVRGWRPWQRHMALVAMAMAFLLQERLRNAEDLPLLSCRGVTSMLKQAFRGNQMTPEELALQMEGRHRRRQHAIDSAYSRQRLSAASRSSYRSRTS